MSVSSLNLIVIRSKDLEKAARFYSALGLLFSTEQHGNGPIHLSAKLEDLVFELYLATGEVLNSEIRLGFHVDSVSEARDRIVAIGGTVVKDIHASEWGTRLVVADFDGHRIELLQTN